MQMLGIGIRHDATYSHMVLDYMGRLAAMASSDTDAEAEALARDGLTPRARPSSTVSL